MSFKTLTIFFLLIHLAGVSQEFSSDNAFLNSRTTEIEIWLDYTGLLGILQLDSLYRKDSTVICDMSTIVQSKTKKIGKEQLTEFVLQIEDSLNVNLYSLLASKIGFITDSEFVQLNINTADCFIDIQLLKGATIIDYLFKMGVVEDGYLIDTGILKGIIQKDNFNFTEASDSISSKLMTHFREFFFEYESRFEEYRFEEIYNLEGLTVFSISNITGAVLQQNNYFEHLRFEFRCNPVEQDNLELTYTINAKYGAGIIWAPLNEDYSDMEPKYAEELRDFRLKMKNEVVHLLKSSK